MQPPVAPKKAIVLDLEVDMMRMLSENVENKQNKCKGFIYLVTSASAHRLTEFGRIVLGGEAEQRKDYCAGLTLPEDADGLHSKSCVCLLC